MTTNDIIPSRSAWLLVGFCFFSGLVHVVTLSLSPAFKAQESVVKANRQGVSFVAGSASEFLPATKKERAVKVAPLRKGNASAVPLHSPVASGVEKKVVVKDKLNKSVTRESDVVPAPELSAKVAPVSDAPLMPKVLRDLDLDKEVKDSPAALVGSPLAVKAPDFDSVAALFNEDVAVEQSDIRSSSQSEANPVSAGRKAETANMEEMASGSGEKLNSQALPLYDKNPKPDYPQVARSRGWQGTVVFEVMVDIDGMVDRITLMESSGYRVLDRAARKSVYRWRFIPAHVGGVAVPCKIQVPIDFHLNSTRG